LRTNANTTDVTNTDCDSNGHSHSNCDGNSDFNRDGDSHSYCNRNGNRYRDSDTDSYCKTFSYAKSESGTKAPADRASAAGVAGVTRLSINCQLR
jgi:hypothetical protein